MKLSFLAVPAVLLFVSGCATDSTSPTAAPLHRASVSALAPVSSYLIDTGPGSTSSTGSSSLFASGSTTCSPQPSCGLNNQFLAGQFTLAAAATIDQVEGWMYIGNGTMDVIIRSDNSGLPGATVYSKQYVVTSQFALDWKTFGDFNTNLPAGTYWLSFEPTNGGGISGGMSGGVASPLAKYAFLSYGNLGWVQLGSNPYSDGKLGMRVRGTTAVTLTPAEMISNVSNTIAGLNLQKGIANSLNAKLKSALSAISAGNTSGACSSLQDLISEIRAQSGKKISAADASALTASIVEIKGALGC